MDDLTTAGSAAIISLVGFGIQRGLQIVDPVLDMASETRPVKAWIAAKELSTTDIKRALMALFAFLMGLLVSSVLDLHLLSSAGLHGHGWMDTTMSALILGAGTEGANSILKTFEAYKDSKKAKVDSVSVSLAVSELDVKPSETVQLRAWVNNTNEQELKWWPVERGLDVNAAGTVTLPPSVEKATTFHVVAESKAYPGKFAVAKLVVA